MRDEARRAHAAEAMAHVRGQRLELRQRRPRETGESRGLAVAGEHCADDALADALILDAERFDFLRHLVAADAERGEQRQQEREAADRRRRPAVVEERRAVEAEAVDLTRAVDGELERKHRAHRQAGDEEMIDVFAQAVGGFRHAGRPVAPAGREQVVDVATMAGELHAEHAETGALQAVADIAHLGRRAGQAVDEQDASAAAAQVEFGRLDHGSGRRRFDAGGIVRPAAWSARLSWGFRRRATGP
jgi:hypothetical protein